MQTRPTEDLARLVGAHSKSLLRLAFAYVRNAQDAEDLVQETYLRYLRARPALESEAHEKAWLMRVTINLCKNHLRSAWIRKRRPLEENLSYLMPETEDLLREVLSLEEIYRVPVHLHYYEGYSIAEIARLLGEKPATIGSRLSRGRARLKARIGGMENA